MNKWIVCLWVILQFGVLSGQESPFATCEINGEDVIIKFHESCLNSSKDACLAMEDFKKYKLDSIIKGGNYLNWQKDGWTLRKTGSSTFQLHKKLLLFDYPFDFEDKFKIDVSYWLFPVSERLKQGSSQVSDEPVRVDFRGNVEFVLKGRINAKKVILSGSFNQWNEQSFKMIKTASGWKLTLQMPPGIYEYKFIVDGEWLTDPTNPFTVQNQHYTYNSILVVGKEMVFYLMGHQNAKSVSLSGSFNNWDEKGLPLKKTKNVWTVTQKLPPGKHYYKFIIDGHEWVIDPDNKLQERDEGGNINSVLIVH